MAWAKQILSPQAKKRQCAQALSGTSVQGPELALKQACLHIPKSFISERISTFAFDFSPYG